MRRAVHALAAMRSLKHRQGLPRRRLRRGRCTLQPCTLRGSPIKARAASHAALAAPTGSLQRCQLIM
jgi:hypothetical protein